MTLLIGSTYASGNQSDLDWLAIQKHFLQSTTEDYHHVGVIPNPVKESTIYDQIDIIKEHNEEHTECPLWAHVFGLRALKEYFENNLDRYDRLLILDSDAFPIKRGWQKLLEKLPHFEIACVIRSELLETRLHSCVLYARPESIPYLCFDASSTKNQTFPRMLDQGILLTNYEDNRRNLVFPMIKSNKFVEHALTGMIYYDMFYHHGSGSRGTKTRAKCYWRDLVGKPCALKAKLMADPNETIATLAGWSTGQYGSQVL